MGALSALKRYHYDSGGGVDATADDPGPANPNQPPPVPDTQQPQGTQPAPQPRGALAGTAPPKYTTQDAYGALRALPEQIKSGYAPYQARMDAANARSAAAIDRAINVLSQSGSNNTVNLPLLAAASALLSPTRTGSFGESLGNAANAAIPAITKQRETDRQNAAAIAQLGIQGASSDQQAAALAGQNYFHLTTAMSHPVEALAQRMTQEERSQLQNQAALAGITGRLEGLRVGADARRYSADQGLAGRQYTADARTDALLGAAAIRAAKPIIVPNGDTVQVYHPDSGFMEDTGVKTTASDKNEWQKSHGDDQLQLARDALEKKFAQGNWAYAGADPSDPTRGIYMNKNSPANQPPQFSAGPPIAPKGTTSGFRDRYNLYFQAYPDQVGTPQGTAGAMAFASGTKHLGDSEIQLAATRVAESELHAMMQNPNALSNPDLIPKDPPGWVDQRAKAIAASIKQERNAPASLPGQPAAPSAAIPGAPPAAAAPPPPPPVANPAPLTRDMVTRRLDQARDALKNGAPRPAVEKTLRDLGIDPGGL